jgi:hypothetical protein
MTGGGWRPQAPPQQKLGDSIPFFGVTGRRDVAKPVQQNEMWQLT